MAGRIREEDIALVRERTRIEDVVGAQLQLRSAGGGSLKGLCPFHDEKSPSFHVTPAKQFFHCFGCQEGGDVIDFVMKVDHLSFAEAIERLAGRTGVTLRYEEGGSAPIRQTGGRQRLVEANAAASAFYRDRLEAPDGEVGRRFLTERGFDAAAAKQFAVGYAPDSWDALSRHLRGQKFSDQELRLAGLAGDGQRGLYDRFRNRLVWPIRDLSGDVIGFGARKLSTDPGDDSPKYLNTPETTLYRKSQVLYGVDLAKRDIIRRFQAVIVEGYTDVMACHLAGVTTAVATCGTAFGEDHTRVLRRLLMDQREFRGEVIFTFDGDAAGQKAALRAFEGDQHFVTQTFVAVEPDGLDPCEVRIKKGDAAVRDLVASRVPLYEFAIRSVLDRHDLETNEGQLAALDAAAPIINGMKDRALRQRYAVSLDKWLGLLDEVFISHRIGDAAKAAARRPADRRGEARPTGSQGEAPAHGAAGDPGAVDRQSEHGTTRSGSTMTLPDPRDPAALDEREALKLAVQQPALAGSAFDHLPAEAFTYPVHALIRAAIAAAGGAAAVAEEGDRGGTWVQALRTHTTDEVARGLLSALAVEPLRADGPPTLRYASARIARVEEVATTRRVLQLKSRLQRLNPVDEPETYNRLFGQLVALEGERIALRERAIGNL
ncbi:MAG: DNA primase [Sporichthyaceae bacterium]|nr:DNA primase [Sporichthyaceae bacterium]